MNNLYILDACALIAFLNAEDGSEKMKELLYNEENKIIMHKVNLCEVYYGYYKADGKEKAEIVLESIMQLPVEYTEEMSLDFIKIVGRFKGTQRISLADAFVLALAEKNNGKVVTTDHSEFDCIDHEGKISFFWLR